MGWQDLARPARQRAQPTGRTDGMSGYLVSCPQITSPCGLGTRGSEMTKDEFEALRKEVSEVSEEYFQAGMSGQMTEDLFNKMKETGDRYRAACISFFDTMRGEK